LTALRSGGLLFGSHWCTNTASTSRCILPGPQKPFRAALTSLLAVLLCASGCGRHSATGPGPQPGGSLVHWQDTDGPRAAVMLSLVVTTRGTWLTGVEGGIFRSTDRGASWQRVARAGYVRSLLAARTDSVWAGVESAIELSTDDGLTWHPIGTPSVDAITGLAFGPGGSLYCGTQNGVFVSGDRGVTWRAFNTGLSSANVECLAVSPNGYLIAGTPAGFFRTPVDSADWSAINRGASWGGSMQVWSLLALPTGVLCAGTTGGTMRSENNGDDWVTVDATHAPFQFARHTSGTLVGGTWHAGMTVSNDAGITWRVRLPSYVETASMAIDTTGDVLAGLNGQPMLRSDDAGETWQQVLPGPNSSSIQGLVTTRSGNLVAAAYPGGLFVSGDAGASWTPAGPSFPIWLLASNGADSLCAIDIDGSIYLSGNGGFIWSTRLPSPPAGSPQCAAIGPGGELWCGTQTGVYRYAAGAWHATGLTWNAAALAVVDTGIVFVAGAGPLWRSTDLGATWTPMNGPAGSIASIAAGPRGDVFAAVPNGVWHTADNGGTWNLLTDLTAVSRLVTVPGRAGGEALAVRGGHVYRYDYTDQHWHALDDDSGFGLIVTLAGKADGSIFAATSGDGVMKGMRP
jgi:hypothetical protein